jgi:death-on-curing protein
MTVYLTVVEALAIHDDQITRYGGSTGVRDFGLLEAALFRPQTGYYTDLIEEAAALWESLSQNHPFSDVNKRTAFAAAYTFIVVNGTILTASAAAAEAFIVPLYSTGTLEFEHLNRWLRANVLLEKSRQQGFTSRVG